MGTKQHPYSVRLTKEVRREAEKMAKAKRRTLSTWIQVAAEEKLQRDRKEVVHHG